jgi:hypothetical protein
MQISHFEMIFFTAEIAEYAELFFHLPVIHQKTGGQEGR